MKLLASVYISKDSAIHRLNFWTKFVCFLVLFPLVSFFSGAYYLVVLLFLLILIAFSKIPLQRFWASTKLYIIPVAIGLLLLSIVFADGAFAEKALLGVILALKFVSLISFGALFSMTTNPIEFPTGFMQIGIPHKFGVALMIGYRMMPLLQRKIGKVVRAQRARGASFRFSFKYPSRFVFQVSSLIVPMLYGALDASVKLSDSLLSRRYNPNATITVPPTNFGKWDVAVIVVSVGLLMALVMS